MSQDNYGFVPFSQKPVPRSDMRDCTHQRFHEKLCSGRLDLLLENKSLLLVAAGSDELGYPLARGSKKTFVTAGGKPVIPGSSLKGVLRSMYEAVTHSCMVMISREYKGRDGFLSRPSDYQPLNNKDLGLAKCRSLAHLCPACALFGALDGRNLTWKGRVNIGDAVLVEDEPKFLMGKAMPQQETPRPKPRPGSKQFTDYYPDGRMAGRKFYQRSQGYGTTQTPDRRNRRAQLAEPLKPGFHFKASLHYTNLKFEELGALLRVILLPEGVLHGVGACKNSGWGAVQIGIERWQKHDPASRYRGGPRSLALVGESLKQASDELIQLSVEQGLLHAGALQRLEELSKPVGLGGLS